MPIKFVHTNIISKDWRLLSNFYVNVFNCKIISSERNLSGDWLEKGTGVKNASLQGVHLQLPGYDESGPTLEIFQYHKNHERINPARANQEGFGHIAFHVDNVEEILEKIISSGGRKIGEIINKDFPQGTLVFAYATDPEENIIEIQNWKSS